jgi:sugar lactone lactonase YvrE
LFQQVAKPKDLTNMMPFRTRTRKAATLTHAVRRRLEGLEHRDVPSVSLSINNVTVAETDSAIRFIDDFVSAGSGGLSNPHDIAFGPDGYLYVASQFSNQVLRYDSHTGAFVDPVVTNGLSGIALDDPWPLIFGPDNKLYVAGRESGNVVRFDPATGTIDEFISSGSGLWQPKGLTFGPDGNLYVSNADVGTTDSSTLQDQVVRYQGPSGQTPGQFIDVFIARGDHGLDNPNGLVFQGNYLYVANTRGDSIFRYDSGTGVFQDVFVPQYSGGLDVPSSIAFRSGYLYVTSQGTAQVLRYDANTGEFVNSVATPGNGATDSTSGLDFDPYGNLYVGFRHGTSATSTLSDTYQVLRYGPSSQAAFTVTLSAAGVTAVTVDYQTADGTAAAGVDYAQQTLHALTFAPGVTTRTVLVPTLDDDTSEPIETFALNLSNAVGAVIADGVGVATITDDDATKFFVVNDGSPDKTFQYGAPGNALAISALATGNTAPRGAASTAAGTTVWVVDANKTVYVYNTAGALLGSWVAGGMSSSAQVEGITTNGTDIWLVDGKQDKVFRYANAAGRLTGSQNAASSFSLNTGNKNPKDLVTDGTSIWVLNDGSPNRVFKYTLAGTLLGNWTIDAANASPTGITLDPTDVGHLWIVDSGTDRVYQYDAAAGRTSGSQSASASFALAAGNTNPQGIADPPAIGIADATATEGSGAIRFIDDFVSASSGGLARPRYAMFGPDRTGDGVVDLYVVSADTDEVLHYDGQSGAFIGVFVSSGSGGLDEPWAMAFGPDGNLFVTGMHSDNVLRYNGTSGAFISAFVPTAGYGLDGPKGILFDQSGHLYISSSTGGGGVPGPHQVLRFQGPNEASPGAPLPAPGQAGAVFVADGSGGLSNPNGLAFGSGGNLYVANTWNDSVNRYDGTTGAFIANFIPSGSGGLDVTSVLTFRNDGYLYVTSQGSHQVLRFDAISGTFVDAVVPAGGGGLGSPAGMAFDANGNLLVASTTTSQVLRYGPSSQAAFTVRLDVPSATPVSVQFTTAPGTALAGSDFTTTSGTITFAPGQTTRTILVRTLDDPLSEGPETFTVNLSNPVGATIADAQAISTITDDEPRLAQIESVVVNGGAAQRSRVTEVTVTFNRLVDFAGAPAAAFRLTRTGPGTPAGDVTLAVDLSGSTATRTVARITFSGLLTEFGSLLDGRYTLTVLSAQVSAGGQPLDGDGNGTAGGDAVTALHRLYGDVTGDALVNGADFNVFRTAFGAGVGNPAYDPALDFDGNGVINGADFNQFRTRFGLGI